MSPQSRADLALGRSGLSASEEHTLSIIAIWLHGVPELSEAAFPGNDVAIQSRFQGAVYWRVGTISHSLVSRYQVFALEENVCVVDLATVPACPPNK